LLDDLVPDGPGRHVDTIESFSERSSRYQEQVTGNPRGKGYWLNGVTFDNYRDGFLLDAKGPRYAELIKVPFIALDKAEEFVDQARKQLRAAEGVPIRWIVAEESVAEGIRNLFKSRRIRGIEVLHEAER
jgi:hypothetical protein